MGVVEVRKVDQAPALIFSGRHSSLRLLLAACMFPEMAAQAGTANPAASRTATPPQRVSCDWGQYRLWPMGLRFPWSVMLSFPAVVFGRPPAAPRGTACMDHRDLHVRAGRQCFRYPCSPHWFALRTGSRSPRKMSEGFVLECRAAFSFR